MKYHEGKPMVGCNYDAGELLEKMRPEVESLLEKAKELFPEIMGLNCPSQSLRAKIVMEHINQKSKNRDWPRRNDMWEAFKIRNRLEAFLHVSETVRIMERCTNASQLDIFGL